MLTEKQFHNVLKAQARFAKAPISFFKPYFEGKKMSKKWYLKYSWTEEQEEKFKQWLIRYLMKVDKQSKTMAKKRVCWYCFEYSWKYKKVK